jgi:serine/threonine-protein kinase
MRCPTPSSWILLAVGITATLASGPEARAQTASNTNVAAEALFEEARSLLAAGKYAEACPKFADSERLGPSVATLLNLANCWEKSGRTATAWATYREAASAANAAGRKDYLATAQRRADGLAPKLARLTITVAQPAPGQQVKRDAVLVDPAEWSLGIPVDTGTHTVEASAPGRKSWSITVDVAQDGAQSTVGIPALDEAPADSTSAVPAVQSPGEAPATSSPGATTEATSTPAPAAGRGGPQRVAGAIVAGVGVVGLGVGGVLALGAKSKYNDSLANCEPASPNLCSAAGLSQRDDARSAGNLATVFVGVGAAAIVAGGILWFTAPRSPAGSASASLQVLPTLGGVVARGAW